METVQWIISAGAGFFEAIQLSNDLSRLRTSLPRARLLIDRAEWGRFKKEELAALLSQLKDTTYDAEDLLREFHDQELRHKIEDADRSRAGQLLSSSLNLARNLIHGSKTRLRETQSKLDKVVAEIEGTLNLMGLNVEPVQLMPETSSVIGEQVLFGRVKELDQVIEMLRATIRRDIEQDQVINLLGVPLARGGRSACATGKRAAVGAGNASRSRVKRLKGESSRAGAEPSVANEDNCTKNVSVLAIVGIGGVGKTTLAQFIYNDARVKDHFGLRMWVCVSDHFDIKRITIQIMKCTSCKTSDTAESLNHLQEQLRKQLEKKKFLLVLDDIWEISNQEWQRLSAPLMYGLEGSMILVTTRLPKIAQLVAPHTQHVQLEGLPADTFWDFFRICAFGNRSAESYPRLEAIGQRIARRLCGSPLAAKTLGRLLNLELTDDHWTRIQNSELWQLPHEENEILPALQLSYLYLPPHLKRCFAFCSMFPKDYSFERDEIVDIWMSQGFVAPGGSMRLEDTGSRYLDDLRSRFLFQADPKLPRRYVMHDLIHDTAQSVSVNECFLMNGGRGGVPHTVRHMSIEVDNEALSRMAGLHHLNKLHSIRFRTRLEVQISWFNQLSNILFLSLKGCKLAKLPESICELNSLRYLDISGSRVQELPEKFWRLYSLQVFDASRSGLQTIHADIKNLINLRRLALPHKASRKLPMISGLGNLSSLRNLGCFHVGNKNGRRIGELKGMNQLSGKLSIKCISKVQSRAEAAEARLVNKQYLEDLTLHWQDRDWGFANKSAENEVLEALRPPSRIERLKVQGFGGDISASWLKPENLPTIRSLELSGCHSLRSLSIPFPSLELLVLHDLGIEALTTFADGMPAGLTGDEHASSSSSNGIARLPLTRLTTIHISHCYKLTNLDQCLSPEYLPSIKSIELRGCRTTSSLPDFGGFSCLQDLKIQNCESLVCPRLQAPSLQRLSICDSSELEKSFPGCLENLGSLTLLHLDSCSNVEYIPLSSIDTNKLQCLVLRHCSELSSIEGPHALSSIQHVVISDCHKLTEVQQPFTKKGLKPEEEKEALKFMFLYDKYGRN